MIDERILLAGRVDHYHTHLLKTLEQLKCLFGETSLESAINEQLDHAMDIRNGLFSGDTDLLDSYEQIEWCLSIDVSDIKAVKND